MLALAALVSAAAVAIAPGDVPDSARGTFVQRKTLVDVDVTLVSKGEFRFEKGRFFEWKVVKPVPSVFFATPTNWSVTVRGKTTAHPLDVDVSSFAKVFEIKEMKEFVKGVRLVPESGLPERVLVDFKNGDKLEIDMVQSR
jgi:hypothetical protein